MTHRLGSVQLRLVVGVLVVALALVAMPRASEANSAGLAAGGCYGNAASWVYGDGSSLTWTTGCGNGVKYLSGILRLVNGTYYSYPWYGSGYDQYWGNYNPTSWIRGGHDLCFIYSCNGYINTASYY